MRDALCCWPETDLADLEQGVLRDLVVNQVVDVLEQALIRVEASQEHLTVLVLLNLGARQGQRVRQDAWLAEQCL